MGSGLSLRRTRAADPKNKKGDKREWGEEGGGEDKKRRKKKGRGLFWAWLMGVFSTVCGFGQKKKFPPRADASGAGKNAPLGHSPFCI